jgi:signal transduction histidine kinase
MAGVLASRQYTAVPVDRNDSGHEETMTGVTKWLGRHDNTMPRYLQALDPRRSLATAFAWFAVVLTLAIALALLTVGDFAVNSMLAQRDAQMLRFATQLAAELEQVTAIEGAASTLPQDRLAEIIDLARARAKPDPRARALLLDDRHNILHDRPAEGVPGAPVSLPGVSLQMIDAVGGADGAGGQRRMVVVFAPEQASPALRRSGIQVAVMQPSEERGHGGTLEEKLTAISILLSIVAAVIGAAFARRLTRRLSSLTAEVQQVANQTAEGIAAPTGHDEVAVLGRAFARLLRALRHERDGLDRLTQELERRVHARTREVERLAADSRYAAVVHERLRLARDLHDTLAHSMVEMLFEVRTLRSLHAHDPQRLPAEFEHAEKLARDGLREAREAVSQMRVNAVRDLGLGAALSVAVSRFVERTGLDVRCDADAATSQFTDTRAEVVFRIAEEALRNVDRHAQASHVEVSLKDVGDGIVELVVTDDGVGFDTAAARPGHFGLTGIREQAQMIDAELELASRPDAGATLRLRLRMEPAVNALGDSGESGDGGDTGDISVTNDTSNTSDDRHDRRRGDGTRSALA